MRQREAMVRGLLVTAAIGLCTAVQDVSAGNDNRGFIYGRITTDSGAEYVGFLRWGNEEAFWDDLFHSTKEDLPYWKQVDKDRRPERKNRSLEDIPILNWFIRVDRKHWSSSRLFISRFGDIRRIRPRGGDGAEVLMKNGESYEVSGYSNDVGGKIHISDVSLGEIDLHWDRIRSIAFMPVPHGENPGVRRLYGVVETTKGKFEGFIQWDKQECLNTDLLDGDTKDGGVSIKMDHIRCIERRSRSSSVIELKDGRTLRLRGSNDVNHENRGIMIEDPRYGRVTADWGAFDRLIFADPPGSGRGFADYPPAKRLAGTVTDRDGATHRGLIVFDLDETEDWEMLNGSWRGIEFDIPFRQIASIEPHGHAESLIVLRNGEELVLQEGQDVCEKNDGVLVIADEDRDPVYLEWEEIELIRFE